MNYSDLTDEQELLLERMGLIDGDTIYQDFPLNSNQLNAIGMGGGARAGSTDTSKIRPDNLDRISVSDDVFKGIDENMSEIAPMRGDTIDYTAKIGVQRGLIEGGEKILQNKLMDDKAMISSINVNTGSKKQDFKNALPLQKIIDDPNIDDEAKSLARNKFHDRFGGGFERIDPKVDDNGILTGAKLQPKGLLRQGADAIFTRQTIDQGDALGYALNPFGWASRGMGVAQGDKYFGDERSMYKTDEVKAIRDRQKATIPTLEKIVGTLYQKEQAEKDPEKKSKLRNTRIGAQGELEKERNPSGMEFVAEMGSAMIDPLTLLDLGFAYKAGQGIYKSAKAGTLLDDTKGLIKGARAGADEVENIMGADDLFSDGSMLPASQDPQPIIPQKTMPMPIGEPSVIANKPDGSLGLDKDPIARYNGGRLVSDMGQSLDGKTFADYKFGVNSPFSNLPKQVIEMPIMPNRSIIPDAKGKMPTPKTSGRQQYVDKDGVERIVPRPLTKAEQVAKDNPQMKEWIETTNKYGETEPREMFHGGADEIDEVDPEGWSGGNTANNETDAFYMTDEDRVAEGYRRHAVLKNQMLDVINDKDSFDEFIEFVKDNHPDYLEEMKRDLELDDLDNYTDDDLFEKLTGIEEFRIIEGRDFGSLGMGGVYGFEDFPQAIQDYVDTKGSMIKGYLGGEKVQDQDWAGETINGVNRGLFNDQQKIVKEGDTHNYAEYPDEALEQYDDDIREYIFENLSDNEDIDLDIMGKVEVDGELPELRQKMLDQLNANGIEVDDDLRPVNYERDWRKVYDIKQEQARNYAWENAEDLGLQDEIDDLRYEAIDEVMSYNGVDPMYDGQGDVFHVRNTIDPIDAGFGDEYYNYDLGLIWDGDKFVKSPEKVNPDAPSSYLYEAGKSPTERKKPKLYENPVDKSFRADPNTERSYLFEAGKSPTRKRKPRVDESFRADPNAKRSYLFENGQSPTKRVVEESKPEQEIYSPKNRMQFERGKDGNLIGHTRKVQVATGKFDDEGKPIFETREYDHNPEIANSFENYMDLAEKKYGVPRVDINVFARTDNKRSKQISDEYQKMKNDPQNPVVKSAYKKMSEEMMDQYQTLIDDGWRFDFYPRNEKGDPADPYGNPRNALEDMRENKHLYVYPTNDGFGTSADFDASDNPLLALSGENFGGEDAFLNDIFRAVHDVFGHGMEEVGFRARGEEHTWRSHARMFSPEARRAVTSETRGQNSWLNFNPITGKKNRTAKVEDTDFADQKTGLMPKWVSEEGLYDNQVIDRLNELRESKGKKPIKGKENPKKFANEPDVDKIIKEFDDIFDGNANNIDIDKAVDIVASTRLKSRGYDTIGDVLSSGNKSDIQTLYKNITGNFAPSKKVYSKDKTGSTNLLKVGEKDPSRPTKLPEKFGLTEEVVPETPDSDLNPVGASIVSVGQKLSSRESSFSQALGNLLQGIGVSASELESAGAGGLVKAIKKGGYKAFVELPEERKDLLKALITDNASYKKMIKELGAREGQLPKEFADEILEGFVTPKGGSGERAQAKKSQMWKGTEARRMEEKALGDFKSEVPVQSIRGWVDEFIHPTNIDGTPMEFRNINEQQIYQALGQNELQNTLSKEALKKMLLYTRKSDMNYSEILDTIRAIDDGIDFTAPRDQVTKVLELRNNLNQMIRGATEKQIELGKLDGLFDEGTDVSEVYKKLRDDLYVAYELNDDFRDYAKLKGKAFGLSDYEVDKMADKVATAFGKITSKKGQTISDLDNNTAFKILKRIDNKQGTDFSDKVRMIMEIYTNPQVEVTKVKGGNKLGGYRLPPRADRQQWAQAEYFSKGGVPDRILALYNRFESALMDWSQPRSDLGATKQNKILIDIVSGLVGKVPQSVILNSLQEAGIPARQMIQIIRPAYQDKGTEASEKYSKDTETKDKREVNFNKERSLSEVGRK